MPSRHAVVEGDGFMSQTSVCFGGKCSYLRRNTEKSCEDAGQFCLFTEQSWKGVCEQRDLQT